ncbi:MAG TPA: hypothetical protein VFB62_20600, partial [Polyangiaceae bacterium]|nr:hypothetical protein [Polyangiaceae bacterium]
VWKLVADGDADELFGFVASSLDVVVNGDRAYWGSENGLHCYPIAGSPELGCAGHILATPAPVVAIAMTASRLHYATSSGAIGMLNLEQTNTPHVPPSAPGPPVGRLVANAEWLAWTHQLVGGVEYGLTTGTLGFSYEPCALSLALSGDSLYFAHGTKLLLKDFASADEPGPVAAAPRPIGELAFDAARQRILWSDESGSLYALDPATGETSLLAQHQGPIGRIAPNAQGVYFLAGGALHFVQR